jgi:hypothetical protein
MVRSTSIMCARCGEHPARSDDEPFCPICVISIKVEVARGLTQLAGYLGAWAAFDDWCAAHGRAGVAA